MDKRFVRKTAADSSDDEQQGSLDRALFQSVQQADLVTACRSLAAGANVNWHNAESGGETCLHVAVQGSAVELSEYLLLNGAKVDARDDAGRTALHLAIRSGVRG